MMRKVVVAERPYVERKAPGWKGGIYVPLYEAVLRDIRLATRKSRFIGPTMTSRGPRYLIREKLVGED